MEIINIEGTKNNQHVFVNVEAKSNSIFEDPKLYLDSNLGLPLVESFNAYSLDRKNIKVRFVFDQSLFKEDKFDLSVLLKDKKNAIERRTLVELKKISNTLNYLIVIQYIA